MTDEIRLELQRLLSALCDGELDTEQHARLEELLASEESCRRMYLEYVDVHARLLVHPGLGVPEPLEQTGVPALSAALPTPAPALARPDRVGWPEVPQTLRYVLVASATLAASLLIQISAGWLWPPQGSPGRTTVAVDTRLSEYVATLTGAADCVWQDPHDPSQIGSRLLPGLLRLQKGIARLRFDSGPDLVVQGPAVLRLDSRTSATVLRGKVVFKGDETDSPFDLHTPSSTLVDFGTEYAVSVSPEGEEVHVFDGEVQRTPRPAAGTAEPEHLKAGQARRYDGTPSWPGKPTPLDPKRFVRQVSSPGEIPPDPASGLLAFEGFDYKDRDALLAGSANGGLGWAGPWVIGFARPLNPGDKNLQVLNAAESLVRPGAATPSAGGSFDYTGFTKYFRRLAAPLRLDTDGVWYLSFLFRRDGPSDHEVNAVALLLWTDDEFQVMPQGKDDTRKRLNVGVRGWNQLFTQLHDVGCRTPLPLRYGETYLLVAKIVASDLNPDQVFMRVYAPEEPIESEEPGSWSVVGQPFLSDLVFDWLQVHINSKKRQTLDEIRLGSTWASVTAPWVTAPRGKKED